VALIPVTADWPQRAEFLVAKAEVSRLAGALNQAEDSLRRALRFYDDRRMLLLAERTRAMLASHVLMLRGLFCLLALVLNLPCIFLALVLDCLSVTLSLLCHAHSQLLPAQGTRRARTGRVPRKAPWRRRSDILPIFHAGTISNPPRNRIASSGNQSASHRLSWLV
jgi:hypothetical protein